eukprot:Gb_00486 [translate_table: standard]
MKDSLEPVLVDHSSIPANSVNGEPARIAVASSPSKASPIVSIASMSAAATVLVSTGSPTISAPIMTLLPTNPASVMASLIPTISTSAATVPPGVPNVHQFVFCL